MHPIPMFSTHYLSSPVCKASAELWGPLATKGQMPLSEQLCYLLHDVCCMVVVDPTMMSHILVPQFLQCKWGDLSVPNKSSVFILKFLLFTNSSTGIHGKSTMKGLV